MDRLYSLQGLRGFAVLGVVLYHMMFVEQKYAGGDRLLPAFFDVLQLGVDLFFIISGFVMVIVSRGRFHRPAQTRRFLFNRLSRIYPTYWLYYGLTLAIYLAQPGMVNSSHGSSNLLASFFLWPTDQVLLVIVGWSLVFELWFYLVFAGLMTLRQRWLAPALALWALVLLVFNSLYDWQALSPVLRIVLHPYALEFIIGVMLARVFYSPLSARIPTSWVCLALALAVLLGLPTIAWSHLYEQQSLARMLVVGGVFGLLVLLMVLLERREHFTMPRFLSFTGDMSYTIYLSHLLVLGVMGRLWMMLGARPETLLDNLLFACVTMLAVLCYGWLGYRFFEKPILDRCNDFSRRTFRVDSIQGRA